MRLEVILEWPEKLELQVCDLLTSQVAAASVL